MTQTRTSHPPTQGLHADQQAVMATLEHLLRPVAQLCLARGVSIQVIEEMVRRAFVHAATLQCAGLHPERSTSRISTMTGLTRREVTRLKAADALAPPMTRSIATDVLTHWTTQLEYVNGKGLPIALPRTGKAPSFEALAQGVTRDVHAKSILEDMLRLGLVEHDTATDMVSLTHSVFVPRGDFPKMMDFIRTNVGDHLAASVDNALGAGDQHFEQALLADELSSPSLETAKSLIARQWQELMTTLGPQLLALMEDDRRHGRAQDQQVRIGLYSYMTPMRASR